MTEIFDFGEALRRMKSGKKVCSKQLHDNGMKWYRLDQDNGFYVTASDCYTEYEYSLPDFTIEELLLEDWYEVTEDVSTN